MQYYYMPRIPCMYESTNISYPCNLSSSHVLTHTGDLRTSISMRTHVTTHSMQFAHLTRFNACWRTSQCISLRHTLTYTQTTALALSLTAPFALTLHKPYFFSSRFRRGHALRVRLFSSPTKKKVRLLTGHTLV
jgi:hypothetical protein